MTIKVTELTFTPHPNKYFGGERAEHDFPNGYTASVITGGHAYTSKGYPYEIAVMRDGELDYTTPVTDDVLGHLTEQEANDVLAAIEALPYTGDSK
jgi:hypothetical protein